MGDVVVALTEGLIADIALRGSEDYIIASGYVAVPLRWGLWGSPSSGWDSVDDMENDVVNNGKVVRFGISRFGSGSHLMATIFAHSQGWDKDSIAFAPPAGSLDGLMASLDNDQADLFLWNYSTTLPVANAHPETLKHIGDLYTPWPCFMIAVSRDLLDNRRPVLDAFLAGVKESTALFLSKGQDSVDYVVEKHGIARDAAHEWFSNVAYAESNIIDSDPPREHLVADLSTQTPPQSALSSSSSP